MNDFIRQIFINKIKSGIDEAINASKVEHPYLTGKLREIVLDNLIDPLLNNHYSTGTGKIIDYQGRLSTEIDICIYSKNLHPPFFFSEKEKIAIFPIESVLKCIEVKSAFNNKSILDAFKKFSVMDEVLQITAGIHDKNDNPLSHVYLKHHYDLFAFDCETKKYSPTYILDIYKNVDPNWNSDPLISNICIANKGWICHTQSGWYHMSYDKKNKINEEIIGYLSTLSQGLPKVEQSRGIPRIGYYLTNPFDMDKIVNGKKIKNTWKNNSVDFQGKEIEPL